MRELDSPPIIIGHSAGGVFTQVLLDHGYGAAGVAINSAPTEGVKVVPLSQVKSTFPVLRNPANRHRAVGLTFEQWHYAFANTFSEEESRRLYERYHIPASGSIFWGSALANIHPGKDDNWVDYANDARAPLLFISGSEDHLMPPKIQQSNAKHYTSNTVTEVKSSTVRTCCLPPRAGSTWPTTRCHGRSSTRPSRARRREGRPPHARRRADRPHRGRRLAAPDRPDVRRPRAQVRLRLGRPRHASSPDRRSPPTRHRTDRRRPAHATTTTATTSTPPGARCCPRPARW